MKGSLHPNYIICKVKCACGNEFETLSLRDSLKVDICSNCHPFYTGKQKFVDTAGRVQKFEKRFNWSDATALSQAVQKSPAQKKKQKVQKIGKVPKSEKKPELKIKKKEQTQASEAQEPPASQQTEPAPESKPEE